MRRWIIHCRDADILTTSRSIITGLLVVTLILFTLTESVFAREIGIINNYPPGITLGLPIGAPLPTGYYYYNESNYYSGRLTAPNSSSIVNTPIVESLSETPKFIWSSPYHIMGAKYIFWIAQPIINQSRTIPHPYRTDSRTSFADTIMLPLILSWDIAAPFYFAFITSVNIPDGQYNKRAFVNLGIPFWTVSPEMAITYLTDQADLTLHAIYSMNTENHQTGYRSGNQIYVDLTATRKWDRYEAGFVAYYDNQVTRDSNNGTFYSRKIPKSRPMQLAPGLFTGITIVHKIQIQLYGTYDIIANDGGLKGCRIFSRVRIPLF